VDALKQMRIEVDLRQQRMTTHIIGQTTPLHFTPESVSVETEDGTLLQRRDQPRASFSSQQLETPWDHPHVAHFNSYADIVLQSDGLLRRQEYTVDVLGGAKGPKYFSEYRNVDGSSVPMKRRAYAYDSIK